MNNIYVSIGLVIGLLLLGYLLGQVWEPYGFVGILAAMIVFVAYTYKRFRRMQ